MERQSILLVHSSMSPKVDNFAKPFKRAPTKLALKKYFRRSSILHKNVLEKPRESVIVINSSSSSSSDEENHADFSPIVIPDSDESQDESPAGESEVKILPPEAKVDKFQHVMQWVNNIDSRNLDETNFTELSTIRASGNFPMDKGVLNSTALDPASRKFDELFKPKGKAFEERQNESANSSPIHVFYNPSSDSSTGRKSVLKNQNIDDVIKDSLEETEKDCTEEDIAFATPLKEPADDADSLCENLLDSLYGDSWRSNRQHIFPQSEPQKKRIQITQVKQPKTEKKPKTVFKPRVEREAMPPKSPWREQLKDLCDSDTSSEEPIKFHQKSPPSFARSKLTFDTPPLSNKENNDTSNVEVPEKKIKKKLVLEPPRKNPLGLTDKIPLSFMASLANDVPLNRCDASARIFRSDYKRCKEELARRLFKTFNENVFDGALSPETELEWNNLLRGTAGRCHCKRIIRRTGEMQRYVRIVLSTKVLDCAERLRNTLIHEMCHAAAWVVNHVTDGHGPVWRSWTDKATQVFPEIPQIRRCHDYEINTKYTYKCVKCGYSIGRHTKSLNIEKKRCGYCYGKFEVFLNKITKKGEKKVVPTPKKEATGWTLFVKENYGSLKTPDLNHGDVMKLLSQKFSSLKVGNAIE